MLTGRPRLSTPEFIERARKLHGDRYDYSRVDYVHSAQKIEIVCEEHGGFTQTPNNHLKRERPKGCPRCALDRSGGRESKGEAAIASVLDWAGLSFEPQWPAPGCTHINQLYFDFKVGDRTLIEFDGQQHFKPVDHFGGEEAFASRKIRDGIKTQWANDNGYRLVRIDYNLMPYIPVVLPDLLSG